MPSSRKLLGLAGIAVLAAAWAVRSASETPIARSPLDMNTRYDLHIPVPALRVSDDPYAGITGQKLHGYLADVVEFSQQSKRDGLKLWGRIAGTIYERRTAQYVRGKFETWGLRDIGERSFPRMPQWWPEDWEVSVIGGSSSGAPARDHPLTSAFPAWSAAKVEGSSATTPPEGIEAELVDIGLGREVDLQGKNLKGKIAVVRSFPTPSPFSHTAFGTAERLERIDGVAGLITVLDIPGNLQTLALGSVSPKFPCFTAGREDGLFLDQVFAASAPSKPPKMRLKLRARVEKDMRVANIYGTLPGTTGEYVIVIAHLDGFFEGAMDNGSGVATMLALAEYFSKRPGPRRRNLMFVGTSGHHAASPGTEYMAKEQPDLMKKTVFVLNSEHTASVNYVRWGDKLMAGNIESPKEASVTNLSPFLLQTLRDAVERYGVPTFTSTSTPHWARGDALRFAATTPVIGLMSLDLYYHTSADTIDYIPPQGMERTTRALAYLLEKADSVSREELEKGAQPLRQR